VIPPETTRQDAGRDEIDGGFGATASEEAA